MGGHTDKKWGFWGFVKWTAVAVGVVTGIFWGYGSFRGRAAPDVIQEETGTPLSRDARVIEVRCEGEPNGILAEAFDRLLSKERTREAIMVPLSCMHRVGHLEMVRVVEDGRGFSRLVKTGTADSDSVEILSGLRKGERVLLSPPSGE